MQSRYRERIHATCPVVMTIGLHANEGRILDLTEPGCLIESALSIKKGDYLRLKMLLPGCPSPCSVALAAVRWVKGSRCGVEFIKMHETAQQQLHQVIARHQPLRLVTQEGSRRRFSEAGGQNWHLETYSLAKGTRRTG
ncbi:MAG: PilZ domain-containing protein [Nitrospirota bacterium]